MDLATAVALILPLNESGAMTTFTLTQTELPKQPNESLLIFSRLVSVMLPRK
jgi:hypothetical protein